ncbi:MAG: hypothetical protein ACOC6Q_02120 [Patescibacteria group bacterium]
MMLVLPVLLSKKNIFVFLILGFLLLAVVFKDSPQRLELDKENFSKARLKLMQVKALSSTDSCRDDDGVCSEGCSPENDTDCVQ